MQSNTPSLLPHQFGPLQGVRIISSGTIIAQPFAAAMAAEMGAEVIQIERTGAGDAVWRNLEFPIQGDNGATVAAGWVQMRRNSFHVTLDLSTPRGKEMFLNLISQADIWMESSIPGTYSEWGLDDETVAAIRSALDSANMAETPIMAYAAKYASAFYGPFREAADSTPQFGDRRGYQMDPPNAREALREIAVNIDEGADIVMVKPALPYLDVLSQARARFDLPLAAYNVSGEYAMIHAAAQNGWLDGRRAVLETLTSIKRAGADIIITYHAKEAAGWLA